MGGDWPAELKYAGKDLLLVCDLLFPSLLHAFPIWKILEEAGLREIADHFEGSGKFAKGY
jgi:hypothetical protein